MIGRIKRLPLKDVWKHEARDFTKWLEENIDVLADCLDMELVSVGREKAAGTFSVDLVAEDREGDIVVIENQLEKSDHDHLGKLLTYLTALEAKTAIWLVSTPRPEHIRAITWLNESSSASFYLLKLEAIQIDNSAPSPLLTLIVSPSEEGREVGKKKKALVESHMVLLKFWTRLLELAKTRTKLHAAISPSTAGWVSTGGGASGLSYSYVVRQHNATVELYIDKGKDCDRQNKVIFERLAAKKKEIEQVFGGALEWQPLEGKRACRICKHISDGGYKDDQKQWGKIQEEMVDAMVRLEAALKPHIKKLKT